MKQNKTSKTLQQILPIAQNINQKITKLIIINILMTLVLSAIQYNHYQQSITTIIITAVIMVIPALVILPFYFASQEIINLPESLSDLSSTVKSSVNNKANNTGIFSNLWKIRSVVTDGLDSYASIGILVNPLIWILSIIAILSIIIISIIVVILLIISII